MPSASIPAIQYCYFPEYFVHLESSPSSPLWRLYYWPATQFYHNRVDHVDFLLSTSNYTKDFVRERWNRESTTIYPPCPIDLYTRLEEDREDLVLTIGRAVPEKRIDVFLEMARRLPDIKFAVVASVAPDREPYFRQLQSAAPGNVSFVVSPLRKVRNLLAKARAYVHCARGEHFGITIVESMAAGCVPIVYNGGGPREIVTDEVGFRWNNVDEAVEQLSKVIKNIALWTRMSTAARARAEQFRPEVFESELAKVLARFER